jgi:hypothetical protein
MVDAVLAEESGSRTHQGPASGPLPDLKSGRPTGGASLPSATRSTACAVVVSRAIRERSSLSTQIRSNRCRWRSSDRRRDGAGTAARVGFLGPLDVNPQQGCRSLPILAAATWTETPASQQHCPVKFRGGHGYGTQRSQSWPLARESRSPPPGGCAARSSRPIVAREDPASEGSRIRANPPGCP